MSKCPQLFPPTKEETVFLGQLAAGIRDRYGRKFCEWNSVDALVHISPPNGWRPSLFSGLIHKMKQTLNKMGAPTQYKTRQNDE